MSDYKAEAENWIMRNTAWRTESAGGKEVVRTLRELLEAAEKRGRVAGLREAANIAHDARFDQLPAWQINEKCVSRAEEVERA